jgi:sedoheptulokinase
LEEAADLSNVSAFRIVDLNRLGLLGPRQLIGGVINQMVDELVDFVKLIPDDLIKNLTAASGSGNGIRKNKAVRQLLQKKVKLPFYITDVEEEAAFGAAIHAGVGSGLFTNYRSALERLQAQNSQNSRFTLGADQA